MKKNKRIDLSKVAGGLSVGGAVLAKGDVNAIDSREVINTSIDSRNFNETKTGVDIGIKVKASKGIGSAADKLTSALKS